MNIIENIKNNLDNMTKSEYAVAVYCLSNLGVFAFDTLEVAAEKAETSTASVIRFCKKMGFDGLRFNSSLHKNGINIVIFNPELCKAISSDLVEIKSINLELDQPSIYKIGT